MRNMTIGIMGLALVLAGCSTPNRVAIRPIQRGGSTTGTGQDAYAEAKKDLEAGHPALALEGFRRALRDNSQTTDVLNGLAVAYDRLGRFDLSRRFYELALAADPDNAKVLHNIAVSMRMSSVNEQQAAADAAPAPAAPASAAESAAIQSERMSPGEIVIHLDDPQPVALELASVKPEQPLVSIADEQRGQTGPSPSGEVAVQLDDPKPVVAVQASAKLAKLLVLNAVGRRGQAGRMRQYLAGVGWVDARIGNARTKFQHSVVFYPHGSREAAEKLAASLPFAPRAIQGKTVSRIVLVLGRNASRFDNELRTRA